MDSDRTTAIVDGAFRQPSMSELKKTGDLDHPPRILLLYGSLRERSYSRLLTAEAELILRKLGAETRIFNPAGLPQVETVEDSHPKVQELREMANWSEGQVWCSPERHGNMTAIMKSASL